MQNTALQIAPDRGDPSGKTAALSSPRQTTKEEKAREREVRDAVTFAAFGLHENTDVVEAVIRELVDLDFHRPFLCTRLG